MIMAYEVTDLEEQEILQERYTLSIERIREIEKEQVVTAPFLDYFKKTAGFIVQMDTLYRQIESGEMKRWTLEQMQRNNHLLYEDILPGNYEESYANPKVACDKLGKEYGRLLCFLYKEIRGMIVYAFEQRLFDMVIHCELFLEIYNQFEENMQTVKEVQDTLYWFVSDYSDTTLTYRIQEQLDTELDFAVRIIMKEDLTDLRYLYLFGEYITDNELKTAQFLNSLPREEIQAMAKTYVDGFRIGFEVAKKDLSKKKIVNIRYHLGFERVIREAIHYFAELGLKPTIYREAVNTINTRVGYQGAYANKQYDYDHRNDKALYLDRAFNQRKLSVLKTAYELYKDKAAVFAGPAVLEVFGETPFVPEAKEESCTLSKKQQKLAVEYSNEAGQIVNQYIKGEERSFTIIAWPLPEIADTEEKYKEIFQEIIRINTLDNQVYRRIQEALIEALDKGEAVRIKGKDGNCTDLRIQLHTLSNPEKETNFENCLADVNIPVGEVFTSPVLKGTTGVLHVSHVYLNELEYKDLKITLTDGMVTDYQCKNFDSEEENKKYIQENVLYHHATLPIGEFAIGTNTTAYMAAKKYGIGAKLPILIAEKMGPHFALGDTCYSWSEELPVYNPDGKEVIARDNEMSLLRKEDISKAYVNCHTDITIPYEEIGEIFVETSCGENIMLIKDGRFVLKGTEKLNEAFDNNLKTL